MNLRSEAGFSLVEMLVFIVIFAVVSAGTTSAVMTMVRSDQYTEELRQVADEGRVSMDRVRKELRGGRRVLDGSHAAHLYWWVDQDQDGLQDLDERVNYCVATFTSDACLAPGGAGKYRLIRYTDGAPSDITVLASTLTSTDVFSGFASPVTDTNVISIDYKLDVRDDGRGPNEMAITGTVRLRNVP